MNLFMTSKAFRAMFPLSALLISWLFLGSTIYSSQENANMVGQSNLDKNVILVTGGSGLVGEAVKFVIENDKGKFGVQPNEEWIFLRSKDGNLV